MSSRPTKASHTAQRTHPSLFAISFPPASHLRFQLLTSLSKRHTTIMDQHKLDKPLSAQRSSKIRARYLLSLDFFERGQCFLGIPISGNEDLLFYKWIEYSLITHNQRVILVYLKTNNFFWTWQTFPKMS